MDIGNGYSGSYESSLNTREVMDRKSRIRSAIFSGFYEIFRKEATREPASTISKVLFGLTNFGVSLQITSLLWESNMDISYWSSYEIFWKYISFTRVDLLCAYLNLIQQALIIVNSMLGLAVLLIILCQTLIIFNRKPHYVIRTLCNRSIRLVSSILFIPILAILSMDFKYYFYTDTSIKEYSVPNTSSGSIESLIRDCLSIAVLLILNIIYEIFAFEIQHCYKDKIINAKSHASVDITAKIFYTFIVFVNLAIYESNQQLFQIIVLILTLYLAFQYLWYLPYYSKLANKIKILISSSEALLALAFLIGYVVDNSTTILTISLLVVPCWLYVLNRLIEYRYRNISKIDYKTCNPYLLELLLRDSLSLETSQDRVPLNRFDKCVLRTRHVDCELVAIWEMYYCLNVLDDIRLAFIKLSRSWLCSYSLQADFQRFKGNVILNSHNLREYEDLSYFRYALGFENIKSDDQNLSITLLLFWGELITEGNLNKLHRLAKQSAKGLLGVKDGYKFLLDNYKISDTCKDYYKSFLMDISSDPDQLVVLNNKINTIKEIYDNKKISFFDEKNGILLISGDESNVGVIVYANSKFAEIIDQSLGTIIGSHISTFIPGLYSAHHNTALLRYVRNCDYTEIPFIGTLFLQVEKGYLVESIIRSRCTAMDSNVFFLTLVKKVEYKRHVILCDNQGIIASYSQKIPELFGLPNKSVKSLYLKDVFPVEIDELNLNTMYKKLFRDNLIGIVKTYRKVGSVLMSVLLIYDDLKEMERWEHEAEDDEVLEEKQVIDIEVSNTAVPKKKVRIAFSEDENENNNNLLYSTDIANESQKYDKVEKIEKLERIEKSDKSSVSALDPNEAYSKKILNEASNAINVYKWILLLFVLVAIGTSLSILSTVIIGVDSQSISDYSIFLGNVLDCIASVSTTSRIIEIKYRQNKNYTADYKIFINKTDTIDQLLAELQVSQISWQSCTAGKFLSDDELPIIDMNNPSYYTKTNLYNFLFEFKSDALTSYSKLISGQNYTKEHFFVVANGIKVSFDYIKEKFHESIKCSSDTSITIYNSNIVILYIGIFALILSIAYVIFFVTSLSRKINQLWTFLSKLSYKNYGNYKATYFNRLCFVNGLDEIEIDEYTIKTKPGAIRFRISFSQIWRYIWRLLILTLISISFYTIVTFVYCDELEKIITNRAFFIEDLYRKNYILYQLNFYVAESIFSNSVYSIQNEFPNIVFVGDPQDAVNTAIQEYDAYKNDIKKKEYTSYMSSQTYTILFESLTTDQVDLTRYGLCSAIDNLILDVYYELGTLDYVYDQIFSATSHAIVASQETLITDINTYLKSSMNTAYNTILAITIFYSIASMMLYLFLYLPYLHQEKNNLCEIQSLVLLVSGSNIRHDF